MKQRNRRDSANRLYPKRRRRFLLRYWTPNSSIFFGPLGGIIRAFDSYKECESNGESIARVVGGSYAIWDDREKRIIRLIDSPKQRRQYNWRLRANQ